MEAVGARLVEAVEMHVHMAKLVREDGTAQVGRQVCDDRDRF